MTFAYLAVWTILAAPPAAPVVLRADAQGRLPVAATRFEEQVEAYTETVIEYGQPLSKYGTRTITVAVSESCDLAAVTGLTATTAGGRPVEMADALKAIRAGGAFVASADGKPVDERYLRLLADDVLVVAGKKLSVRDLGRPHAPHLIEVKTDDRGEFAHTFTLPERIPVDDSGALISAHVSVRLPARDLPTTTAGGEPVAPADAAKAYAAGVTVVVSADGKPIDAKFLALFKPDTPVLTLKALTAK